MLPTPAQLSSPERLRGGLHVVLEEAMHTAWPHEMLERRMAASPICGARRLPYTLLPSRA